MATTRNLVKTYLDDIELARLDRLAGQLRLSRSELLRRLLMNRKLPDHRTFEASHAILDLLKVNADQARLGNLFKLALDEPLSADLLAKFDQLIVEIEGTQNALKDLVRQIDHSIRHKAQ
ncbi:ribbon-helix-helix protein, CopG family [Thalassospira sp. NFXS8]|uniref:plasmid mobilization protein n=1 Tax=Thalassospira sp. NFXS8 TaxID=2819093 RepID=UPI0032DE73C7